MLKSENELKISLSHELFPLGSGSLCIPTSHEGRQINQIVHYMQGVGYCLRFMEFILGTNATLVGLKEMPSGRTRRQWEEMRRLAKSFPSSLRFIRPGISYHPLIQLFLDHYRLHPIAGCTPSLDMPVWRDHFNDFIGRLRTAALEINIKKRIGNWNSKYAKAAKRLLKIENDLFERYSRIAVVRLDLAYLGSLLDQETFDQFRNCNEAISEIEFETYMKGDESTPEFQLADRVPLEILMKDRSRFFANIKGRPTLFEHLIGYAWRIEWTPRVGFHLHLVMFFDGSQVQKHQYLAQMIGEYWADDITDGRGRFFNANLAWKEQDPRRGIGLICWDDHARRTNLRKALSYLAKDSQMVAVMPYRGWNAFGTGGFRRGRASSRGRPRTGTKQASAPGVGVRTPFLSHPKSSDPLRDNSLHK